MPVLSLPLFLPAMATPIWFPIRIPFPMMRIGSILPSSINEPVKNSLLALFRLAWSSKVQLPLLITVCFMAFDIRLQLEINIFWENPRGNANGRQARANRGAGGLNQEAVRAAVLNASLIHRQRQRQLLQERARQQELGGALNGGRHNFPAVHVEDIIDDDEEDSQTTESASDHPETSQGQDRQKKKKKRRVKGEATEGDEDSEDSEDEENSDADSDNDGEDDDDDDFTYEDDDDGGASQNPDLFGDSDDDPDYTDDNSQGGGSGSDDDDSNEGGTPLVVELEIRQRPEFKALATRMRSIVQTFSSGIVQPMKQELLVPFVSSSLDRGNPDEFLSITPTITPALVI